MSQLEGLVTNLRTDIDGLMLSERSSILAKQRFNQLSSSKNSEMKFDEWKTRADKKEDLLTLDDMSDVNSMV